MSIDIGYKIKTMRISKGISQNTLAKKAGIAQSTLSYIEGGYKQPKFETLQRICQGLESGVFELMEYTGKTAAAKQLEVKTEAVPPGYDVAADADKSLYEQYLVEQK